MPVSARKTGGPFAFGAALLALLTLGSSPTSALTEPVVRIDNVIVDSGSPEEEPSARTSPRGALCDTGIICGSIKNDGAVTFTAATNYVSPTQVGSGAKRMSVAPGQRAQAMGPSRDWDAYWVPAGYCRTLWAGPYWDQKSTMNRVGQASGRWDKVDDWGGRVKLTYGKCSN